MSQRKSRGGLRDAIGAGAVSGLRETDDAAEGFHGARDPLVIGGHDDRIDAVGCRRTTVDVLDHRTASDVSENFSGESRES